MDILEIQDDPTFSNYLEEKLLKPSTIENYSYHMLKYCISTGLTPTQLLEEAEYEEEERIPIRMFQVAIDHALNLLCET